MEFPEHIILEIFKHADPKTKVLSRQVCKTLYNEFDNLSTCNILHLKFVLSIMMEMIYNKDTRVKFCDIYIKGHYQIEKTRIVYKELKNQIVIIHFGSDKSDVPRILFRFTPPLIDKEFTIKFVLETFTKARSYNKIKSIICKMNKVYFGLEGNPWCLINTMITSFGVDLIGML